MSSPLDAALEAHHAGLCVLPPLEDGSKRPMESWTRYQRERPDEDQIRRWYADGRCGVGVVCGEVSGGLELLDFDDRGIYKAFRQRANRVGLEDLLRRVERGYLEKTPNGAHILYRCKAAKSRKLARWVVADSAKAVIETKGEGGFAVVAPSSGGVHETGRPYELVWGDFETIVTITTEERELLHDVARSFDALPKAASSQPTKRRAAAQSQGRPGDDFNARAIWAEILEPHGWAMVFERDGEAYWRRPGKAQGIGATTNYQGSDLFYVFSTSTPFETERGYSKFSAYALLEHDDDFAAAARSLAGRGYGSKEPRPQEAQPEEELEPGANRPVVVRLSDVEPREVEWLWQARIPLAKVAIIDGDPGLGKSALTLDLAARVSTGRPMPDGTPGVAGGVVLLSAEDDLADTIRPRLDAAGGDLDRVRALTAVREPSGECLPEIPQHLAEFEQVIVEVNARLVVVDPLMAFLGAEVHAHSDQEVRRALAPLKVLAERTGAAVLVVRHLNKGGTGTNPIYRGGGSIGIIGAARSGLLVARDPDDEGRRVLAVLKSNLALPAPALGFQVVEAGASIAIEWLGTTDHTAAGLLAAPASPDERSALDEAIDFLQAELSSGPCQVHDLKKHAGGAGIGWRTVERAKAKLGLEAYKGGLRDGWYWRISSKTANTSNPQKHGGLRDTWRPSHYSEHLRHSEDRYSTEGRQPQEVADDGEPGEFEEGLV